ncbi:MAG: 2-C-methyl-D-erythritol 2,4-cyclodiphosphate synthase [Bacteroidetes bacterium]|nr:MAG: 2-C-methyl-D-erythritol 2,4-cyclodiphosphate synthase [Bacteroidota bacterium]
MKFKVGYGYDVHKLEAGYKLMVGGIEIPFEKGSVGHSDGDVLIHAIMDALLGAAGLRDIGCQFPDHDPALKGIDSKILLEKTLGLIKEKGFSIGNIDATVALEAPKINYAVPQMQQILSGILDIPADDISVKATTTEKLGFVGRGEGIAAHAVVLIYK